MPSAEQLQHMAGMIPVGVQKEVGKAVAKGVVNSFFSK